MPTGRARLVARAPSCRKHLLEPVSTIAMIGPPSGTVFLQSWLITHPSVLSVVSIIADAEHCAAYVAASAGYERLSCTMQCPTAMKSIDAYDAM